ncbi:hypothetical protein ACFRKB_11305 [Streptomyces scopuliridis]|uniref:hypothetical protein n=1 Tax=Streptomyces scopuliridis TaxID=452529 RepID=UPI00368D676E
MSQKTDPDHYGDCPVNTSDGPSWAPTKCRCDAINAEADAYYAEPRNMGALEEGAATTPRW